MVCTYLRKVQITECGTYLRKVHTECGAYLRKVHGADLRQVDTWCVGLITYMSRLILGTYGTYGMSTSLNKRVHKQEDTYDTDRRLYFNTSTYSGESKCGKYAVHISESEGSIYMLLNEWNWLLSWRTNVSQWYVRGTYFWVRRLYVCYLTNEVEYYPEERMFLSDTANEERESTRLCLSRILIEAKF